MDTDYNLVVVTDLDGTLLDHNTYSFEPARPALHCLERLHIPLVLSSSKTAAEILDLRSQLDNREPFIVENGAGIMLPEAGGEYKKINLGLNREAVLDILNKLPMEIKSLFRGFADMTADEIMDRTGLSNEQAVKAMQRDFTEPVVWEGNAAQWQQFRTELEQQGLTLTRGGRFIHISGSADKGKALQWLKEYFIHHHDGQVRILALGDSDNDRSMLEQADYAVIIRSPAHKPPAVMATNLLISEEYGPAGWNRCVMKLLEELGFNIKGVADG